VIFMLGLASHVSARQLEIDTVLGDMGDVRRVDETGPMPCLDHYPVEDVLFLVGEDLLDPSDLPPLSVMHRRTDGECLICDRRAGVSLSVHARKLAERRPGRGSGTG